MTDARQELAAGQGADPSGWRWGRRHILTIKNQTFGTSSVALLARIFNTGPLRVSGSRDAVFATGTAADQGHAVEWVPSMHMVVDLADLGASRWVDLTGVSGHTGHAYYGDQTSTWAAGGAYPWPWAPADVRAAARHTLTLTG